MIWHICVTDADEKIRWDMVTANTREQARNLAEAIYPDCHIEVVHPDDHIVEY